MDENKRNEWMRREIRREENEWSQVFGSVPTK